MEKRISFYDAFSSILSVLFSGLRRFHLAGFFPVLCLVIHISVLKSPLSSLHTQALGHLTLGHDFRTFRDTSLDYLLRAFELILNDFFGFDSY